MSTENTSFLWHLLFFKAWYLNCRYELSPSLLNFAGLWRKSAGEGLLCCSQFINHARFWFKPEHFIQFLTISVWHLMQSFLLRNQIKFDFYSFSGYVCSIRSSCCALRGRPCRIWGSTADYSSLSPENSWTQLLPGLTQGAVHTSSCKVSQLRPQIPLSSI